MYSAFRYFVTIRCARLDEYGAQGGMNTMREAGRVRCARLEEYGAQGRMKTMRESG
jgi:hypothetical protein